MVVSEAQRQLAIEKADALATVLRDGTTSLLVGRAKPEEAIPILSRLIELLKAAGKDVGTILEEALSAAEAEGFRKEWE